MSKSLKILEDTILEIEAEIKKNPDPFLISTLERLKIYQENEINRMIKKAYMSSYNRNAMVKGGFRGSEYASL